jgi:hypothetical protein
MKIRKRSEARSISFDEMVNRPLGFEISGELAHAQRMPILKKENTGLEQRLANLTQLNANLQSLLILLERCGPKIKKRSRPGSYPQNRRN